MPQLPEKSIDELVREVRSRCCDKIQDQYSKIQLLNLQRIDVDQLYVDVYVLEKLTSASHATIPDLLKGSNLRNDFDRLGLGQRGKRSPGFEVASQHPRLMILGKPGSGKSTFLRHLAIVCCKSEFQADHIPILVELRDIKDATRFNLLNTIHKEFGLANQAQVEQILNQGKVLILLDGLDEVPGQSRRDVQDHIYEFSQQYYKNRFILTCRTQTTEYTLSMFDYVEVAEFKPEQVEIFAKNWFTALAETPEQGAELTVKFLGKLRLPENKQTAELAVTPILLSLTCWVFNDLKDLPAQRSDLYEQGINLLLEKWDEKRGVTRELGSEAYRKLSIEEKKKLLSYLAARKFEQEQYVLFEQGELQGYIAEYLGISTEDSEAVLDAVAAQHGLLIERAQGFWSFSHLTFQEYFTAKWFCDRADWQGLVAHIAEIRWIEVFLLTVNMMQNPEYFLQLMKEYADQLLASCKKSQQFLNWLAQKASTAKSEDTVPYKLITIKAFYLTSAVEDNGTLIHGGLAAVIDSDYRKLVFDFNSSNRHSAIVPELALDYYLNNAIANDFEFTLFARDFDHALALDIEPELKESLQAIARRLKEELPAPETKVIDEQVCTDWTKVSAWWIANRRCWIDEIKFLVSHHRNISYDWQFSTEEKELIQKYYSANSLLVKCLNSGCEVSKAVKEEIEETLLLPIDEIKKRQQQMQVKDVAGE